MSKEALDELDKARDKARNWPSIELDCAPGWPRPGDLIDGVIEGTGLPKQEPDSKLFGAWAWYYNVPRDKWAAEIVPVIKPRIEKLYHDGLIRYGSW